MFKRISEELNAWQRRRESLALHAKTLTAYRSGEYPENPTIGIGLAFQQGLLKAHVLYEHAWCQKALQEGPIFLEAWRKASTDAKPIRNLRQFLYQPKEVLDNSMPVFQRAWDRECSTEQAWTRGWPDESLGDTRSSTMRVVAWIDTQHPHWIEAHLDTTLFASNMSIFDTLLYHDLSTSSWASEQWPERVLNKEFAWDDWLSKSAIWLYPIVHSSYRAPKDEWFRISKHFQAWSPLLGLEPEEQLRKAIEMMELPGKDTGRNDAMYRGILWKALTHNVPPDIADSIGAAFGCAWPDMHSNCLGIRRHFYPGLDDNTNTREMGGFFENEVVIERTWSKSAAATFFLYDNPEQWVQAIIDGWATTTKNINNPTTELEFPSSLFD